MYLPMLAGSTIWTGMACPSSNKICVMPPSAPALVTEVTLTGWLMPSRVGGVTQRYAFTSTAPWLEELGRTQQNRLWRCRAGQLWGFWWWWGCRLGSVFSWTQGRLYLDGLSDKRRALLKDKFAHQVCPRQQGTFSQMKPGKFLWTNILPLTLIEHLFKVICF